MKKKLVLSILLSVLPIALHGAAQQLTPQQEAENVAVKLIFNICSDTAEKKWLLLQLGKAQESIATGNVDKDALVRHVYAATQAELKKHKEACETLLSPEDEATMEAGVALFDSINTSVKELHEKERQAREREIFNALVRREYLRQTKEMVVMKKLI